MIRNENYLIGKEFERLTVIGFSHRASRNRRYWLCRCICGNEKAIREDSLLSGRIRSCGCLMIEKTGKLMLSHGMSQTRLYSTWQKMKMRCCNPNDHSFKNYGARGIMVCKEWQNSFEAFYKWAMANGYEEHLTIDRIDNDGNYCPENCRWATLKEQANNRSNNHLISYQGKTQTLHQWADELGLDYKRLVKNIATQNRDIEKAFALTRRKVLKS